MRTVIQRVSKASVSIADVQKASIGQGLLVLVGIEAADEQQDVDWMCQKIVQLRIFDDLQRIPNRSLAEVGGELLLISQFTLFASTQKGNRPSYLKAAKPIQAIPIYEQMIATFEKLLHKKISTGQFGADMQVQLINNGPITILMDTKNKS